MEEEFSSRVKKESGGYYGKEVPEEAYLLELGWYTKEVIVTYVQYKRYGEKRCYVEKNMRQRMIKDRQR